MKALAAARGVICSIGLLMLPVVTCAQLLTVTAHVKSEARKHHNPRHASNQVVIWLTPIGPEVRPISHTAGDQRPRLVQHNKGFEPHLLVVPVGSVVEFPNRDPFFHNVFSLFEGKRFDLGLYEAGSTRDVRFDKPGVSYIFCNIHAEMSAVVIAVPTPYFGISDQQGEIAIPNVPAGVYKLQVWYEAAVPERLDSRSREVEVSSQNADLGTIRVPRAAPTLVHKNKYGRDYDPPAPDSPAYQQQR